LGVKGLSIEFLQPENRTPLLYVEVEGSNKNNTDTHLFYGHADK